MRPRTVRLWSILHTWSSLLSTAFLLVLCVTGLPLIFHDEIDAAFAPVGTLADPPPPRSIDALADAAREAVPGQVVQYIVWEPESPEEVIFSLAKSATAYPTDNVNLVLDAVTAEPADNAGGRATEWLLELHGQLLLGALGPPILGLVAFAFLLSLISGVVLYAPFMRRLPYGTVRRESGVRTRRLDWHNLLGITIAAWLLVVGGTGWINAWGNYIFQIWQAGFMAPTPEGVELVAPARKPSEVVAAAEAAMPGLDPAIVAYPGSLMADPDHFVVYLRGRTSFESRLMHAALVDAETGKVASVPDIPWFITGLLLSQPLHFGDYGGLPLKLLWAVFDCIAIAVLWTGIRLWWRKRPA